MDTMGIIYLKITARNVPLNISKLPEDGDSRSGCI
jgi:hypothetical protein